MLETVPNRNWPQFYSTLMAIGHSHLAPSSLAMFVEAENLAGTEAFYSESVEEIINFGLEGSARGDVEHALDAWLEEITGVLVNDFQVDEELARTVRLTDRDSLAERLVESLALPTADGRGP